MVFTAAVVLGCVGVVSADECKSSKFPYARKQSNEAFGKLFQALDREALIQYYFSELTDLKKDSVAKPLATYLAQTENNNDTRGFFKSLRWAANLDGDQPGGPKPLKLKEICAVYKKVLSSR